MAKKLSAVKECNEKKVELSEDKKIIQSLLEFLYTMQYPFADDKDSWQRGNHLDKDVTMYMLAIKYMIPDLRAQAGQAFRDKVDYICEEFPIDDDIRMDAFYNAIKTVYEELSDDDWPRWYLVQHIFHSRARFLPDGQFKNFLKGNPALYGDFIDEVAFDSKMWEWRKQCRELRTGPIGSRRWLSTYCFSNGGEEVLLKASLGYR